MVLDPATALQVAGVALQFSESVFKACETIYTFFQDVKRLDETAQEFASEIRALQTACQLVHSQVKRLAQERSTQDQDDEESDTLFASLEQQLKECNRTVQQLQAAVSRVDTESVDKAGLARKAIRQIQLNLKASDIASVRDRIRTHTIGLQLALHSINLNVSYLIPNRVDEKLRPLLDKILHQKEALETVREERVAEDGPSQAQTEATLLESSDRIISGAETLYSESVFGDSTRRESILGKSAYIHGWITDANAVDDLASRGEETEPSSVFSGPQNERSASWTDETASAGRVADVGGEENGTGADEPYSDDEFAIEAAQHAIHDGQSAFEREDYTEASEYLQEALKMVRELPSSRQRIYDACDIRYMLGVCFFHLHEPLAAKEALLAVIDNTQRAKVQDDKRRNQVLNTGHLLAQTHVRLGELELARSSCDNTLRGRARILGKAHKLYFESLALMWRIAELQGNSTRARIYGNMLPADQKTPLQDSFKQLNIDCGLPEGANTVQVGSSASPVVEQFRSVESPGRVPIQNGPANAVTSSAPSSPLGEPRTKSVKEYEVIARDHDDGAAGKQDTLSETATLPSFTGTPKALQDLGSEQRKRHSGPTEAFGTQLTRFATDDSNAESIDRADNSREVTSTSPTVHEAGPRQQQTIVQNLDPLRSAPVLDSFGGDLRLESSESNHSRSYSTADVDTRDQPPVSRSDSTLAKSVDVDYANAALKELALAKSYRSPEPATLSTRNTLLEAIAEGPLEWIDRIYESSAQKALLRALLENTDQIRAASKYARKQGRGGLVMSAFNAMGMVTLGDSPLHLASLYGDVEVVRILVRAKAKLNNSVKPGLTALHCAALAGHYSVAKVLIDAGCRVDCFTREYGEPLDLAVTTERYDTIDLLLRSGASTTPVHAHEACATGNLDLLKALFTKAQLLKVKTSAISPSWYWRIRNLVAKEPPHDDGLLRFWRSRGGSFAWKWKYLMNPSLLMTASYMGREEVAKYLISIGFDPWAECTLTMAWGQEHERDEGWPSEYKYSILEMACSGGNGEVVRALLEAGATTRSTPKTASDPEHNWDALWVAVSKSSSTCVKALLDRGIPMRFSILFYAMREGMEDLMSTLVDYHIPTFNAASAFKVEVDTQGGKERSPARRACLELLILGSKELATSMWKPATDRAKATNDYDGTLLHMIIPDDALAARLLIHAGAAVDATNSKGETPLMLAAQRGNNLVVEELLSNGASRHAQDKKGRSAVQYALDKGDKAVIELFLRPDHNG